MELGGGPGEITVPMAWGKKLSLSLFLLCDCGSAGLMAAAETVLQDPTGFCSAPPVV